MDPNHSEARDAAPAGWSRTEAILLLSIAAVAVILRVREAMSAGLWFDEIYRIWAARGGPGAVLQLAAHDVHPPFHLLAVSLWSWIGGECGVWQRSLSIAFGVGGIAVTFLMTRAMFGAAAGTLAAAFLAIHPVHVQSSQEVNAYALLWLLLGLGTWFAWRWCTLRRPADGVVYALVAALALYTHYLAGAVLAFVALWGVFALRRDAPGRLQWALLHVLIAALFAPQVPTFAAQVARIGGEHWAKPPASEELVTWARRLSFGALYLIPVFAALAVLPVVRHVRNGGAASRPGDSRTAAALLWLVALGPVVGFLLTPQGARLFTARYMYQAIPAAMALAAAGVLLLPRPAVRIGLGALLLFFGVRAMALHDPQPEARALDDAAAHLETRIAPEELVLHADTHSFLYFQHRYGDRFRHRLLWPDAHIPYYEGALVIADSLRLGAEAFVQPPPSWWGIRLRHAGVDGDTAAAWFARGAEAPPQVFGPVSIWRHAGKAQPDAD